MSGVGALLRLDGAPVDPAELARVSEALAHRGGDAAGAWHGGPIGLAHRASWTTPEAVGERMPLVAHGGALVLAADARLDNRAQLLAQLRPTAPADDVTDAELVLAAYERWGERCPERLLGDFAFALWDAGNRRLFCARDHFGVRPLYYHRGGRDLIVASAVPAVLAARRVPRQLNEERVAAFLAGMLEDREQTAYVGVERLPAAHTLTADARGVRVCRYWALEPGPELRLRSDGEYEEAFRETFGEAVRCRLRTAEPPGALLSGGLDSSAVVGVARELEAARGRGPLRTFSAVFDDVPEADERRFIAAIADTGRVEPTFVRGDRLGPLAGTDGLDVAGDEVSYAPNLFLHCALYRAAEAGGVRVLLDGLDGDTTVSHGLARLTELARRGRVVAVGRMLAEVSRRNALPAWRLARRRVVAPLLPARLVARRTAGVELVNPALAARVGLVERVAARRRADAAAAKSLRTDHAHALGSGALQTVLEVADRASAAFGIEPRYPFFDRRLVELCLALPADQKLRHGWTRWILRRALAGFLPEAVGWRTGKTDLGPNFVHGLRSYDRGRLDRLVADGAAIAPYVDPRALEAAYGRFRTGAGGDADAVTLWKAAALERWLAANLDSS